MVSVEAALLQYRVIVQFQLQSFFMHIETVGEGVETDNHFFTYIHAKRYFVLICVITSFSLAYWSSFVLLHVSSYQIN
jgi:hypothetical protein